MATILSVGYPLARVGPTAVGGAEQVLSALDRGLVRAGHQSLVIAPEGSHAEGMLIPIRWRGGVLDEAARREAQVEQRAAVVAALERWPVDLVHMHGLDFLEALPPRGIPVLATLHLPPSWYPPEVFRLERPGTYLNCVSATQEAACPAGAKVVPYIGNGVALGGAGSAGRAAANARGARKPSWVGWAECPIIRRREVAGSLGGICPEKGFHHALDAARLAGAPLLLAGEVYRYPEHERYFHTEIVPRLDPRRRFLGPLGRRGKRRLLGSAHAVLIPSLAPETSSLVAMEALASGAPVVAFRAGALVELVEPGRTGFLVEDAREMAEALGLVATLDREECRAVARERFGEERMVAEYLRLYEELRCGSR
jgi:glycosyltransferase involved in cell wall biosynthesis